MRILISRAHGWVTLRWMAAIFASVAWVFVAMNLRSPYLLAFRDPLFWIWVIAGFLAGAGAYRLRRNVFIRPTPAHLVATAALLGGLIAGQARWVHDQHRKRVSAAAHMPDLGNHLIIGWLGMPETRTLAAKGGIAGVFLTNRSFPARSTISDIRQTVDELQAVREKAGLPPLWIATDQEGGPVEKLTPPLSAQPALLALLDDLDGPGLARDPARIAEIIRRVTIYADTQGKELAEAGINLNFAPVVDLRPTAPPGALDFHSRIATRALAADPETVALAGETYVRTLAKHGVTAVLKHFPGLGRVPEDTHHFAATLDFAPDDLSSTEWLPFRKISKSTDTAIMLGHVRLSSIDPNHPVSCSPDVVRFLREDWEFRGLLITDDFSMAPISHGPGGIKRATKQCMTAGVDLILLSYDPVVVYDLLGTELDQ